MALTKNSTELAEAALKKSEKLKKYYAIKENQLAWAVVTQFGIILYGSIRGTRVESIDAYCKEWGLTKADWKFGPARKSFRCRQIILKEL